MRLSRAAPWAVALALAAPQLARAVPSGPPPCEEAVALLRRGAAAEALSLLESTGIEGQLVCTSARAQALFVLGRFEEAAAQYEKALALAPELHSLSFNLGLARLRSAQLVLGAYMLRHDQARAAGEAFERAATLAPDRADYRFHVGLAAELRQEVETALTEYDRSLAVDPGHALAHRQRGILLMQEGRTAEAHAALAAARARAPADALTAYHLGKAASQLGKDAEALEAFRAAVGLDPLSREAHFNLARTLLRLGQEDEAAKVRQRFEQLGESLDSESARVAGMASDGAARRDPRFHVAMAVQHEQAGRFDEALESYHAALSLRPRSFELNLRAAILLGRTGRLPDAEVGLRRAIDINPASRDAHVHLGGALARLSRFSEAEIELRTALRLGPDGADVRELLALVLERLGRRQEAALERAAAARLGTEGRP